MPTLHNAINALAETFAHDLLRALRGASLEDIISETSAGHVGRRGPGRPPATHAAAPKKARKRVRRSADDIAKTVEKIAAVLKGHKSGLRSEQLQKILHIAKKDITKPIIVALKSKTIRKTGQKRATTYFAG